VKRLLLLTSIVFCMGADAPEVKITEISLNRSPSFGYGISPVDLLVLRPDGTADYFGKRHVTRVGHYKGRFDPDDFNQPAKLVASSRQFDRDSYHGAAVNHSPSATTTIKRGDKTTQATRQGRNGPLELWTVETAIRGVAADIVWEKVE
jgi:hypothetical protein